MLNDKQKQAVRELNTSLLIVAGAGTGKTRVLTEKVAHLLDQGVRPDSILALTFTNKASDEMRDRIQSPSRASLPFIGTFHSFCFALLREFARQADLHESFVVFDRDACRTVIKRIMRDLSIASHTPGVLQRVIGRMKTGLPEEAPSDPVYDRAREILPRYTEALRRDGAVDFDDLILKAIALLRADQEVYETVTGRYAYILVDEFQDTDRMQNNLVSLLKGDRTYIVAVGDTDQTIYSWRGADVQTLLSFTNHYRPAKTVLLTQNYRSTGTILKAANRVIEKNSQRQEKELTTKREDGARIVILEGNRSEEDEAAHVARTVTSLRDRGIPYGDIAVLFRVNFQSRALETGMLYERVPYTVLGTRFFDRREVKDLLAYLTLTQNPESRASFDRAAGVPRRGIGAKTLERVFRGEESSLSSGMRSRVAALRSDIDRARRHAQEHTVADTLRFLSHEVLRYGDYLKETYDDHEERLQEVRELFVFAERFSHLPGPDGIAQMLAEVALSGDQDSLRARTKDAVRLMTVHAAKGLEFPCVIVAGMEEGLFPLQREDEDGDLEEERRLCYVAMTRAKDRLYFSYAERRGIFGSYRDRKPSSFLSDIPDMLREQRSLTAPENSIGEGKVISW